MKRKSKLEKFTPVVLGVCMLTFVAACGSDDDSSSSSGTPQQEESQEGVYSAVLTPVPGNEDVAGSITGTAAFTILGDQFTAAMEVRNAPAGAHIQHIHAGRACPTAASDTNADGKVDLAEANAVSGLVLIPLDSDLATQDGGSDNSSGANYVYSQSASFSQMLADLSADDTNTTDAVTKLPPGENLNLEGRVVMVHGTPGDTTLPIACAILKREAGGTTGGTATGGTATGGTATGGTATGGTATGGTATGGTATGGTATGGTATGGTATGGTATGGTATGGTATGGTATGGTATGGTTTSGATTGFSGI